MKWKWLRRNSEPSADGQQALTQAIQMRESVREGWPSTLLHAERMRAWRSDGSNHFRESIELAYAARDSRARNRRKDDV